MEEEVKTPKPKGGARAGAGRKPKANVSHRMQFRCAEDVWRILQLVPNKTEYIEKAIREKYRRQTW